MIQDRIRSEILKVGTRIPGNLREPSGRKPERRWVHPTREIERALAPLSVQGIHLQRNQIREFSALKKAPQA